jgi:hypothetical protein
MLACKLSKNDDRKEIIMILLKHGANPVATNNAGKMALDLLDKESNPMICTLLEYYMEARGVTVEPFEHIKKVQEPEETKKPEELEEPKKVEEPTKVEEPKKMVLFNVQSDDMFSNIHLLRMLSSRFTFEELSKTSKEIAKDLDLTNITKALITYNFMDNEITLISEKDMEAFWHLVGKNIKKDEDLPTKINLEFI